MTPYFETTPVLAWIAGAIAGSIFTLNAMTWMKVGLIGLFLRLLCGLGVALGSFCVLLVLTNLTCHVTGLYEAPTSPFAGGILAFIGGGMIALSVMGLLDLRDKESKK